MRTRESSHTKSSRDATLSDKRNHRTALARGLPNSPGRTHLAAEPTLTLFPTYRHAARNRPLKTVSRERPVCHRDTLILCARRSRYRDLEWYFTDEVTRLEGLSARPELFNNRASRIQKKFTHYLTPSFRYVNLLECRISKRTLKKIAILYTLARWSYCLL